MGSGAALLGKWPHPVEEVSYSHLDGESVWDLLADKG
jgi:hypothetical protein